MRFLIIVFVAILLIDAGLKQNLGSLLCSIIAPGYMVDLQLFDTKDLPI